jgi:steroid delta-isomerase-like uncharacterized protein
MQKEKPIMNEENNLSVLKRAIENFSDLGNRESYFELYDANIVLHGYAGVEPGLASVKQFYQALWLAFPDSRLTVEDMFAKDDKVVCRFTMWATHQGEFMNVPATGKSISLPGITILRFVDGKCVERWSQANFLSVLQQIGALPA